MTTTTQTPQSEAYMDTDRCVFQVESLEQHILIDLVADIREHYQYCEQVLITMDRSPFDAELVRCLFRSVHTIKGNLAIVGFSPVLPLVGAAEDLLGSLREGDIEYTPILSDLVLLMLDRVREFVEQYCLDGSAEYEPVIIQLVSNQISGLNSHPASEQQRIMAQAISHLDPSVIAISNTSTSAAEQGYFLDEFGLAEDLDVAFFRQLMEPVEARSHYWQGRSDRILRMVLTLNKLAGKPVDELNLAVAVYVHDFGMAFVPVELLHKNGDLNEAEIALMRSHVQSSANLLQHMPRWAQAKKIVLQHHETADGLGYPYGLCDKEICEGAKILAVADTFDAMTHQRAYAAHQKRPILRAAKEINDCSGRQLSPYWVNIFNQAVKSVLTAHKNKRGTLKASA